MPSCPPARLSPVLCRARARLVLASAAAMLLAACGGGGGGGGDGVLTVSLSYSGNALLMRPSTIPANITGLDGHTPTCSLVSGTIPAGMALNRDCSISGTPLVAGSFPIVVRLGASGASNQLDWSGAVLVLGPSVVYSVPATMMVGASYDLPTLNAFWTAGAGDVVGYSVAEGSLPPGLAIDAATGRITGTPTAEGSYSFKIKAQLDNAGRVASTVSQFPELVTVTRPTIPYSLGQAWAGLAFRSTPSLPSGDASYVFSTTPALPAGLSIDPSTGIISGTPTALAASADYRVNVAGTGASGGTFTNYSDIRIGVESPVYIRYAGTTGHLGLPISDPPVFVNNSGDPLTGISYAYALDPASSLPLGLSLDPATGEITGTPTTYSGMSVRINVTVTVYGHAFVVPVDTVVSVQ